MSTITSMFMKGVDNWDEYAPTANRLTDDHAAHVIMSKVALIVPTPLAVTGSVTGGSMADIVALGEDLIARAVDDGEGAVVDVYPYSSLVSIRIDSAPMITKGSFDTRGSASASFTLQFEWGSATVNRYHGDEAERAVLLANFASKLKGG